MTLLILGQENIVRYIAQEESEQNPILIMEYVGPAILKGLLEKRRLLSSDLHKFFCQLIYDLEYFHSQNIIYRNIKPSNILIDDDLDQLKVKYCNFDLAKEESYLDIFCSSVLYTVPEIFGTGYKYTIKTDI